MGTDWIKQALDGMHSTDLPSSVPERGGWTNRGLDDARSVFSRIDYLGPTEAHVWTVPLEPGRDWVLFLSELLSPSEWERARRFHFDLHRDRFIAARGWLRSILGHYLRVKPADLEFSYGSLGKPSLSGVFATCPLRFNLSRSEDLGLLVLTCEGEVGIDVERTRMPEDADQLVVRFFSAREREAFLELPDDAKTVAFFNLWTRKEAWLKAIGKGIGNLLNKVEVSFLPGEPPQLLRMPRGPWSAGPWVLRDVPCRAGFTTTLAVAAPHVQVRCRQLVVGATKITPSGSVLQQQDPGLTS